MKKVLLTTVIFLAACTKVATPPSPAIDLGIKSQATGIKSISQVSNVVTAEFETTTQAYKLYNIQIDYQIFNQWNFSLSMRNITNTVYYDHLSRLKAYNLYNQGRNFVFSFRKTF
jgi:outer membrane receptor protein involved in Fe transport